MADKLDESIFGGVDTEPAHSRAERRAKAPQPQGDHRVRRLIVLLVSVGLIAGVGLLAVNLARPVIARFTATTPDYPGPGEGVVNVTVAAGDTGSVIGTTLFEADVIASAQAFLEASAADPRAASIQPGTYALKSAMKASDALAMLLDPANRTVPRVTVREGLWASEIYKLLAKATGEPLADYVAAAKDAEALGLPASAKGRVEGFLFPATYEFAPDASAATQLRTMVSQTRKELDTLGVTDKAANRIMTLASIAESEARTDSDRAKVVRVLLNRIEADRALQLDSTVSYAAKRRSITTTDAERASTSPYNTYVVLGLPPGPISNPGASAIKAAVNPAKGDWLYFVAVNPDTGETKFATTFAEHERNVALFQAWCQANKGSC